jgi:hypothetical protein
MDGVDLMAKVFITQEKGRKIDGQWVREFDLTPALKYGEIEVLLPPGQSLFGTVPVVRALKEKLKNFTDEDYLLPVGDPSVMIAAGMVASHINHGKVKILKWDRIMGEYIAVQFDLSGKAI